jgi:hypothetical protein
MFSPCASLPDRLRHLSAQDYLTLRSTDKLQLITWLKQKQWQEIHQFAASLQPSL